MVLDLAILGCGQWGPNHIRVFSSCEGVRVRLCADSDPARLERAKRLFPWIETTRDVSRILSARDVDAVVVATPSATHAAFALEALESGKDVLCEKPLATTAADARKLSRVARERERILMVGHVFLYNPGIQTLKQLLEGGEAGRVHYLSAERTNLGPIRRDVNVLLDLASHDISILNYLLGSSPRTVSARGRAYVQEGIEDVAFATLEYPGEILAAITVSWLHPRKVRRLTVVGQKKMIVWDEHSTLGPVTIYDKCVTREPDYANFGEFQLLAREGDVSIPRVQVQEPLAVQAQAFLEAVRTRRQPLSSGELGVEVISALEALNASLAADGAPRPLANE